MSSPAEFASGSRPCKKQDRDPSQFPAFLRGKRILLCTESFGPVNGVSRTTLMLVNHLRNHGVQVAVVAPHNHTNHNTFSPPPSPNLSPADKQPELRLKGYPLPFNPELSIVYPVRNSTLYSRTFGHGSPPDLVYLASPASLGFQVMLQLRQQPFEKQIPVICNFQTDLAGYCAILFPWPLSRVAVFAFDAVQSHLFRHPSIRTIFYPSSFVRRYLVGNKVQPDKLQLLTRGVNTDMFDPKRRSHELRNELAPNGETIFVTVSRIAGEKGFDFLAKAAKELEARGVNFKLYVVGGNRNPDVEKEVQELFHPLLGEQGKVVFAGFKVGQDLATAYASGDVFLHCSVTETFGLVVLESMASGVPVIARDEGGPSDIVRHGDTGFLVQPNDVDAFVTKAVKLANDRTLRQRMGAAAREAACQATWDKINNKVAWRMADAISEREQESRSSQPAAPASTAQHLVPIYGWLMMNDALREVVTRGIIDARLMGGLGIIITCWAVTGCYVLFTECLMWAKGRMRAGDRRVSVTA
ncbi:Glycosyl transferase, family 1 [Metarhizium album ARSEF 1941]|uniref:Glycosyl transferase, family 1 n=1 Tax=Metarhizium album (strain ARSEF 1941) TaxID=1081103 RepID=A0A0B2WZB5_METAS|nr:Glycosyl transferase, family 1 [Metarhizium album ARSEF 1941]KHN99378.1 Glycosyl transferase, family 1 [Metarhizium album ARSEF 1941]